MKRRILWLVLSFLVVAALVVTSCAKEEVVTPGEQEEEEEVVTPGEEVEEEEEVVVPAAGEPVYGGRLTLLYNQTDFLGSPDPQWGVYNTFAFWSSVMERPFCGDVYKYGARGTGEWLFSQVTYTPEKYLTGALAESWEVTPDKIVLHMRQGVLWYADHVDFMETREFTADDMVWNLIRAADPASPGSGYYDGIYWVKEPHEEHIYATDRYTVVIETNYYHSAWTFILTGGSGQVIAPECVEKADVTKWENLVGTGPFYIKKYVPGSHMLYGRNPYYWQKATINGIEYDTPFLDEYIHVMIKDVATTVAALRTATLDVEMKVPPEQAASLDKTNPELMKVRNTAAGWSMTLFLRCDQPPFSDRNVRRALFIGTDRTVANAVNMIKMDYYEWPIAKGTAGYVPMERLPASCQELLTYDPVKAKQMLADAGYPTGFTMQINTSTRANMAVIAELLADQWKKLGITVEIIVKVETTINKISREHTYQGATTAWSSMDQPDIISTGFWTITGPRNYSAYYDEYSSSRLLAAVSEIDEAKRTTMLEEVFVHMLDDAPCIAFGYPCDSTYFWPWVKNCYGEVAYFNQSPDYHNWWLDAKLKATMGY